MTGKQYIQELKPTTTGAIIVLVMLFAIPLVADFFLLSMNTGRVGKDILMSPTLINGYMRLLPWYITYILICFIFLFTVNYILKTIKLEKFCFRS